jgi:uncharacterized DUF497 family protein
VPPEFEHDPTKSFANLWKHGLTLAEAERLWLDPNRHYQPTPPKDGETRFKITARLEGQLWTCVFTLRAGSHRLISCRRAWKSEGNAYHLRRI